MITLFKKIRKGLLDSSQARKYILYAVGEILLVVIGILIALQINNWNEYRKERALETSMLLEIKNSLEDDITVLKDQVSFQETVWKGIKELLQQLEVKESYDQAMDPLFSNALKMSRLTLNRSSFDMLEQRGVNLILNDTLRKAIVTHFNYDQQDILMRNDVWIDIHNRFAFYYEDLLDVDISDDYTINYELEKERMIPLNYSEFMNDEKLNSELKYRIHRIVREIALIEGFIAKQTKLLSLINNSIDENIN